jgi:hypothetical protein
MIKFDQIQEIKFSKYNLTLEDIDKQKASDIYLNAQNQRGNNNWLVFEVVMKKHPFLSNVFI